MIMYRLNAVSCRITLFARPFVQCRNLFFGTGVETTKGILHLRGEVTKTPEYVLSMMEWLMNCY